MRKWESAGGNGSYGQRKWELVRDRGIYENYGSYNLSWGLYIEQEKFMECT